MKTALYARVSTNNGQDPEMQLRELREYCQRQGWEASQEYVDIGISGGKEKRPELDKLLADVHKRHFDAVVVWRFDRFARSVSHLLRALLRKFFRFAQKHGYVERNLASDLEMPKSKSRPTLPFSNEEWRRILGAFSVYEKRAGRASAHRLRAFVLLLRFSGMRIGDAVRCEESWIEGNSISFISQKTSVHVCNKLPDEVIQALETVPLNSGRYFFWTGASTLHSAVGKWQRRLQTLFALAGVQDGRAHRFRNSYAHDMAVNGQMTLEELKQALGHKTTRTTERYYSHWLKDRQDRLEKKQELAWAGQSALPALGGKEDRPI